MFVAQQKKKENIIEYVLYLWYIEDVIRAFHLDIQQIRLQIIEKANLPDKEKQQLEQWYLDWIKTLRKENKTEKGHAGFLQEILMELSYLHQMLLYITKAPNYIALFEAAREDISLLHQKNAKNKSDVEVILEALYGKMILGLKGEKVSQATQDALQKMSKMMAYLAKEYQKLYQNTAQWRN